MQQIHRRTAMPKCNVNKVAKQLYWNRASAWVLSCKFVAYFQNTFSYKKKTSKDLKKEIVGIDDSKTKQKQNIFDSN